MAAETYKALCVSSLFNITCFYFYWIYFLLFMSIFSRVSLYFFWQLQLLEQETLWRHRRFVILRYFQKVAQHDWLLGWFFLSFEVEWFGQLVGQLVLILLYVLKRVILLWLNGRELLLLLLLLLQMQREQNLFMNLNDLFIYKTPKVPA